MLGDYLKTFRLRLGITQKDMAKRLNISTSILCRMEKGKCNITNEFMDKIVDIFSDFLTDEDYNQINLYRLGINSGEILTKENVKMITNKILKEFRINHNMTQLQMAEKLGYSISYISCLENNNAIMSESFIQKILTIFEEQIKVDEKEAFLKYLEDGFANKGLNTCGKNLILGDWLKEFRLKHRLSRKVVASDLGVSQSFISMLELGKSQMSYDLFSKIMDIYSEIVTDDERTRVLSLISKNIPNFSERKISNFIISNELGEILLNFSELHLSREEINSIFIKALDDAKTLKKQRG